MTGHEVRLFLPCTVFSVQSRVRAAKLTPLEQLVLRAIHHGAKTASDVGVLFGLGDRPTLDLLYDLWARAHIRIDLDTGQLWVVPDVARHIRKGELDKLAGAKVVENPVSLMQELLTGRILLVSGARSLPRDAHLIPPQRHPLDLSDVPKGDLVSCAWREILRRQSSDAPAGDRRAAARSLLAESNDDERLPDVVIEMPRDLQPDHTRYLELRVMCSRWAKIDALSFRIVGGGLGGSARVRKQVEQALFRAAREQPNLDVWKQIRKNVATTDVISEEHTEVAALQELLSDTTAEDLNEERWERLRTLVDEAEQEVQSREEQRVQVRLLQRPQDVHAALEEIIGLARRQIVLFTPSVSRGVWNRMEPALEAALDRGVKVILSWGASRNAVMDEGLKRQLIDLRSRQPDFSYVPRPTGTRASFALVDADRALLTSHRYLDDGNAGHDIGALLERSEVERPEVERPDDGAAERWSPAEVVLSLLQWARLVIPDYLISRDILTDPADFVPTNATMDDRTSGRSAGSIDLSDVPLPATIEARRAFLSALSAVVANLVERRDRARVTARVVPGSDQDRFLASGAQRARKRWLVTVHSDQLTPVERIRQALPSGQLDPAASVRIVVKDLKSELPLQDSPLRALLPDAPEQARVRYTKTHACLLVADDAILFAWDELFSTLSRLRSSVSIALEGEELSRSIHERLGSAGAELPTPPKAKEVLPRPVPARVPVPARPAAVAALLDLLVGEMSGDGGRDARVEALRRHFAATRTPAEDVEALLDAGVPAPHEALAVCLELRAQHVSKEALHRMRAGLARHAWHARRFWEAAILLWDVDPSALPEATPTPALSMLAALADTEELEERLAEVALTSPLSEAEAWTATLIALRRWLVGGITDDALEALEMILPAPAAPIARLVSGFWQQFQQPLPLGWLRQRERQRDADVNAESAYVDLQHAVDWAHGLRFDFSIGVRTWVHLFQHPPWGSLKDALEKGDRRAAERHARALRADFTGSIPKVAAAILDRAVVDANTRIARIEGKRRRPCLERLTEVLECADTWLRLTAGPGSLEQGELERQSLDLLRALAPHEQVLRDVARREAVTAPLVGALGELIALGKS